jgi:hypothetical protein
MKIKLILDTCEIVARRFKLEGPHFRILENAIREGKVELIVPQIVLEETRNKYLEHLAKADDDLEKSSVMLNSLLTTERRRSHQHLDRKAAAADFLIGLDERLKDLRATIPGYEDIPHAGVVRRELDRRRPFREGRGYRDTLIWESILRQVLTKAGRAVLVTRNQKDFCAETTSDVLHSHLVKDLLDLGLDEDSIKVCENIEKFVNEYLKHYLLTVTEVLSAIREGKYSPFSFNRFLNENREEIDNRLSRDLLGAKIPGWEDLLEDPKVTYVNDPTHVEIVEAYEISEKTLFLAFDVRAEIELFLLIFKADFSIAPDDLDIQVDDWDWNDHYLRATASLVLPFRVSLILNVPSNELESFEIELATFHGWCWKCSAPLTSDAAETCNECGSNLIR